MTDVMHVISDTNIGGAGRCIISFLKEYDKDKFRVSVVLPYNSKLKPEILKYGVRVFEVNGLAESSFNLKAMLSLVKIFKKYKPDIIHTHAALSARLAGRIAGKSKIVYTRHSVFPQKWYLTFGPFKLINFIVSSLTCDHVIAVADAAKKNLLETGVPAGKVSVVYNGVSEVDLLSDERCLYFKTKFSINPRDRLVAIVARLTEVKGHEYFINAAEIVSEKLKNVRFLIAGTGEYEKNLRRLVKEKNLQGVVLFLGFVEEVDELMNVIDIQVNASFGTEAASLSLMEGMSLGKPAVVSDFGGNPEIISDGENGFVVPQRDSRALAEKILLLLNNEDLYSEISKNSAEIFKRRFRLRIMVENIQNIYTSLLI